MFLAAVCDDEPFFQNALADRLAAYLQERGTACEVRCFSGGRALLDSPASFDLIFLDVWMEGMDGMETARQLRESGYRGPLLFLSALREPVFDAFAVGACDYLVKPLDSQRFRRAMDRAMALLRQEAGPCLTVRKGLSCQVVPFSEILCCEVLGRKVTIRRRDGAIEFYERLDRLEAQLDSRFFRCHRSYLVNLDCIRSCRGGAAVLLDGTEVLVARKREKPLAQALLDRMKKRRC